MLELIFEFEDGFGIKLPGDLTSPAHRRRNGVADGPPDHQR
jgi:acyl carrier protein